jgi:hypothetical protein
MWDLNSNQAIQVAQHDAPVKTVHYIKANNYTCVMTGSWDKTIKVLLSIVFFQFINNEFLSQNKVMGHEISAAGNDCKPS